MSKRLQVLLPEAECRRLQLIAKRRGVTLSTWVREVLRVAANETPRTAGARKREVLQTAKAHAFPTGDIDQLLAELERGRGEPA